MQCALTTHSFYEHVEKSKTESLSREKDATEISIKPVLFSKKEGKAEEGKNIELIEEKEMYYVVESKNSIERWFICPSMKVYLSQCRLEQCTKGALLALNPDMPEEHFGRQCILAKFVAFFGPGFDPKLPVCSFMRAMVALSKIWNVIDSHAVGIQCSLRLKMNEGKTYNFHYLNKEFKELENLAVGSTVEESLQAFLNETMNLCPKENIREFHVCFFFAEAEEVTRNFPALSRCEFSFYLHGDITNNVANNKTYPTSGGPMAGAKTWRSRSLIFFTSLKITLCWMF